MLSQSFLRNISRFCFKRTSNIERQFFVRNCIVNKNHNNVNYSTFSYYTDLRVIDHQRLSFNASPHSVTGLLLLPVSNRNYLLSAPRFFHFSAATMSDSDEKKPVHENRLTKEKSPYLLQHKNNPVDWYPWGEEAFAKAKNEGKLIFLSIGYSTCHWCHVMERESFENESIAKVMNDHFVSIKVDREERPDVDRIYMTFIQATQGGGGWPLNVFLTPDLKPVTGGTYFPPEDSWNRPGFPSILKKIVKMWTERREDVETQSSQLMEALRDGISSATKGEEGTPLPSRNVFLKCLKSFSKNFDKKEGGFEKRPKFPQPVNLNFLVRVSQLSDCQEERPMAMVYKTLDGMANGGIYDHIGYGFHRYSTDEHWHVPHFEKMLYDNAQLLVAYVEAFQISQNPDYEVIATHIMEYISRDMTDPSGGIYSAEDADSLANKSTKQKTEGAFYVWTEEEIISSLKGKNETSKNVPFSHVFNKHYGVKKDGNVDPYQDPHGELTGKNVLLVRGSVVKTSEAVGLSIEETKDVLEESRKILFSLRQQRPRPHLDDKMIAAWNGLMLSGFSRAAQALQNSKAKSQALGIAAFARKYLYDEERKILLHSVYKGQTEPSQIARPIEAFCEDYACLIRGLLDLYETCYDPAHLLWAHDLQKKQDELFWDTEGGAYFSSHSQDETLLLRLKEEADGAEPSPNSVSAGNLLRLALFFDNREWEKKAEKIFSVFSERLNEIPRAVPEMVAALMFHHEKPAQVVICGEQDDPSVANLVKVVQTTFAPFKCVLLMDRRNTEALKTVGVSSITDAPGGVGSVHMCRNQTCGAPIRDLAELQRQLTNMSKK